MILAIDPSLTSTGICFPDQSTTTIQSKLKGPARLIEIRNRINQILIEHMIRAVIIEDYAYGAANAAHQIGELGGILRVLFCESICPVALVGPSALKKWLTGKGNSGKAAMVSEATNLAGRTFATDDEADAWALGAMAAQHTGAPWAKCTAYRVDALAKITWPTGWPEAMP